MSARVRASVTVSASFAAKPRSTRMAKKLLELDTPFRVGEKVVVMRDLGPVPAGSAVKVKLVNGFSAWIRYWIQLEDGELVGHVDHNDLARPDQIEAWHRRQEEAAAAAAAPAASAQAEPAAVAAGGGGNTSGIPDHILERSRAAKARKLGG
jgi:hypothetical protein